VTQIYRLQHPTHNMPQQQLQQQQQHAPQKVRFPPPFASINNPHNHHLHKPHWLHNPFHHHNMEQPKLAANFSGTWIKVCCVPSALAVAQRASLGTAATAA
jgi:lipocalin